MFTTIMRTLVVYVLIIAGMRIMGKRQISQLQASELVVTLLISELAIMPIQNRFESLWTGLIPMLLLILCEVIVSFLMLKSGKFRKIICGKPIMVIENGVILQKNMRKLRMTIEDMIVQLRQNDVFYLKEVAYAIIETNGMMSVIKNPEYDYLTPKEAKIDCQFDGLELIVVSDGEFSDHSLELCEKTREWALEKIKKENLTLKEVFMMAAGTGEEYTIVRRHV